MSLSLDPHQKETIKYGIKNPYSIFALEMGLGKTPVALVIHKIKGGRLLVICPSYLVLNWRDEILKWRKDKPKVVMFPKGKDIRDLRGTDADICLISYALVQKAEHLFEWADMVVLDEAHEVKSMKAKKTEFIHRCIFENSIKRLHLLTGTPIKNRVEEYYSLICLMNYDPKIEKSEFLDRFQTAVEFADRFSFRNEYTIQINNRYIPIVKWTGLKNAAELKKYLVGKYIRFKSEDVLKLRPISFKDILISDSSDIALLNEFQSFFEGDGNDSTVSNVKAEAALKKVPFTLKYVEKLVEEVDNVVIYTDHVQACEALALGLGVPAITGKMPAKKRHAVAEAFKKGETKFLVATIKSFSTGVDLTQSSNMVINDLPWIPGDLQQTIFRIQRRSQTKHCTVHRLLGSPQDRMILKTLEAKSKVISEVT